MIKKTILLLSLLGTAQEGLSATYYVSNTKGLNTYNGTSLLTPVKTIQQGINLATMPNDVVYVDTGVYKEAININKTGITVSALDGNLPIIDGGTTLPYTSWGSLVKITGDNNTFKGFEVKNSNSNGHTVGGYGIEVLGNGNEVSDVSVHDVYETGVLLSGDNSTLKNSSVYRAALRTKLTGYNLSSGWAMGVTAANGGQRSAIAGITSNAIIKNNNIYNNFGEGVGCFNATHCTIDGNNVYDNWTVNIYPADLSFSTIKNNLIYNSSNPAIPSRNNSKPPCLLMSNENTIILSHDIEIYNNMCFNGKVSLFGWTGIAGYGLNNVLFSNNTIVDGNLTTASSSNVSVNSKIANNIFLGNSTMLPNIPSKTGITFTNNNWHIAPPLNATSTTDLIGDPLLSKNGTTTQGALTKLYFKLNSNSGVRGKGVTLSQYTTDAFDTTRPIGAWDMGAHQYVVTTSNPEPICRMICVAP